ncbi:hypothetical protein J437_LFUL003981 [Ladona fulva]|uniref:Uncharacterized protein n=1 Tax=Ladona fulva TaxID=123851 RepID=A0A8K0K4Q0_LADFU|nr:hypothetical protein J437_LFUL003981 [Ladona fulva]
MEELEKEILILKQRCAASSNGGGNAFPRPSPPPAWNMTPRQQTTGNAKGASPANSEGWVTPNRLTLKKTSSPSNIMNISQHSLSQSFSKQKISPSLTSTPQKFSVYPKMNGSASIGGNFRSYRGYSSATPSTPINCNIMIKGLNNRGKPVVPSPRMPSYCMGGSTPISSGSLLSNLKLTSPL